MVYWQFLQPATFAPERNVALLPLHRFAVLGFPPQPKFRRTAQDRFEPQRAVRCDRRPAFDQIVDLVLGKTCPRRIDNYQLFLEDRAINKLLGTGS